MNRFIGNEIDVAGLIFALVIAILITFFFVYVIRSKGPWKTIWPFFFVIFLGVWSASFWIHPLGPTLQDVAWVPLLFIGLIISLLLSIAIPPKKRKYKDNKKDIDQPKNALTAFFWLLIIILVIPIILGLLS